MKSYFLSDKANAAIDDIYTYTLDRWGEAQADIYLGGLFECFEKIAEQQIIGRTAPAGLDIDAQYHRYKRHYVYWRINPDKPIYILAILHEKMLPTKHLS